MRSINGPGTARAYKSRSHDPVPQQTRVVTKNRLFEQERRPFPSSPAKMAFEDVLQSMNETIQSALDEVCIGLFF